jgi:transposase-like protein
MKYRTVYDRQPKAETNKIILENKRPYAQVSEELGIHENTHRRWVKGFEGYGVDAFPGNGVAKGCLEYEPAELKQGNPVLQMENELSRRLQVFLAEEKENGTDF